ncbi:PadR family transcriptional regulator [candidate division KSB1 bacterium]
MNKKYLTRNDEMLMLAIMRLKDNAYLVTLRDFLNNNTGRKWTIGNIFVALEKLENLEYISSVLGEPTIKRGGKAIKYYSVTKDGIRELKKVRSIQDELWSGLYDHVFSA